MHTRRTKPSGDGARSCFATGAAATGRVTRLAAACTVLSLAGCVTYAPIENQSETTSPEASSYSLADYHPRARTGSDSIMLAFSGGGTRAAALSYGVLKELRDTPVQTEGGQSRLLDLVGSISSVSGGSFTSAYYGLYGDAIFDDFETVFLRRNVQGDLLHYLVNPLNWFRIANRTEWAINYYEQHVFRGATFADLQAANGPLILINASDLAAGVGFWFVQEYFDLLCSDISSLPISRAVAASSAVPGVFSPVVLKNYADCAPTGSQFLEVARSEAAKEPELEMVLEGLESYLDKDLRPYVHLVDGGITDNLGLRSIYDLPRFVGGIGNYYHRYDRKPPRRLVVIAVDAATAPAQAMNRSNRIPPISEVINAMSDVQLHRYNADTLSLMQKGLQDWSEALSTPEHPVDSYFIYLRLNQVTDPEQQAFLNEIPTSFSLTDTQIDTLVETGGDLLRNHPEFQRLVKDLDAES